METGRIEPIKSHDLLVSLVSIQLFFYYEMAYHLLKVLISWSVLLVSPRSVEAGVPDLDKKNRITPHPNHLPPTYPHSPKKH